MCIKPSARSGRRGWIPEVRISPPPGLCRPFCPFCHGLLQLTFRAHWSSVNGATLGEKLGFRKLDSLLLKKASSLGLKTGEALENLAISRGCHHYSNHGCSCPSRDIPLKDFTNEELAVALLSPVLPYSPRTIRIGAAMLGAPGNNGTTISRLAIEESAVAPVRYIASAALKFEPQNNFWHRLLDELPDTPAPPDGVMPHPTRFVSMTGFTRNGPCNVSTWIRPSPEFVSVHG
jgi:hypothetical protein